MTGCIPRFMTRFISRWFPDPLIFATSPTLLTFVIVLWLTPQTSTSMVKMWGDGFWSLLAFGVQMALIIVTGHTLVSSALVKSLLRTAASAAKTSVQGVMLATLPGPVACVTNWEFGLVVGAMFAREVARRVPGFDYPSLIACVYIGFLTQGDGFSGSMSLLAATSGNLVEYIAGLIPAGDTLFSGFNILTTVVLTVVMPFTTHMMMPKPSDVVSIDPKLLMEEADFRKQLSKDAPSSERLEESRILTSVIGAFGIAHLAMYFSEHGFNITINTVSLMFIIVGLLLHKTLMTYARAISAAARSTIGILVQFPFYAGIQLIMEHSGLGGFITEFFINVANKDTFPVMTSLSSALINFAVPSGGGYQVIQGSLVMPVAQALGTDLGKSVMAITYGEQWMNMAQPLWAPPALVIAGLGVRDIMGYCTTALLFSDVIFVVGLTLF